MDEKKITRRNLLKAGATVGVAAAAVASVPAVAGVTKNGSKADRSRLSRSGAGAPKPAATPLDYAAALALTKFVWPVLQPPILTPGTSADGSDWSAPVKVSHW